MQLIHTSKWFNSATFRSTDTLGLDSIDQLPFVLSFRQTKGKANAQRPDKFNQRKQAEIGDHYSSYYGGSTQQVTMLNAHLLRPDRLSKQDMHQHAQCTGWSDQPPRGGMACQRGFPVLHHHVISIYWLQ